MTRCSRTRSKGDPGAQEDDCTGDTGPEAGRLLPQRGEGPPRGQDGQEGAVDAHDQEVLQHGRRARGPARKDRQAARLRRRAVPLGGARDTRAEPQVLHELGLRRAAREVRPRRGGRVGRPARQRADAAQLHRLASRDGPGRGAREEPAPLRPRGRPAGGQAAPARLRPGQVRRRPHRALPVHAAAHVALPGRLRAGPQVRLGGGVRGHLPLHVQDRGAAGGAGHRPGQRLRRVRDLRRGVRHRDVRRVPEGAGPQALVLQQARPGEQGGRREQREVCKIIILLSTEAQRDLAGQGLAARVVRAQQPAHTQGHLPQ